MYRWRITVTIYPHSTGNGREADLKAAGGEHGDHYFYVDAESFEEATKMAACYSKGIEAHPMVWKAPIMGVHRYQP